MIEKQKIEERIKNLYHEFVCDDKCYLLYFEYPFWADGFYFKINKFFNYFTRDPIDHVAILPSKKQNDEKIKILEATLNYGVIRSGLIEKLCKISDINIHLQFSIINLMKKNILNLELKS